MFDLGTPVGSYCRILSDSNTKDPLLNPVPGFLSDFVKSSDLIGFRQDADRFRIGSDIGFNQLGRDLLNCILLCLFRTGHSDVPRKLKKSEANAR
jgi:hypothetical protein